MNLRLQILALAIVPLVIAIMAVTGLITWQSTILVQTSIDTFEQNMLLAKRNELLNLTNLALSSIDKIYQNAGPDDEVAKQNVMDILGALDYGEDGYFFVYQYDGLNLVHPRQKFRPGQNWINLIDPDGDHAIANLIATAKAGGGLHQYKWEKPSAGVVVDKLSWAVGLDKWNWMLGTGVYLDDVYAQTEAANAELRSSIGWTFFVVAIIAVPAVLIVFATCMSLNIRERRLADSKLKQLTQRIITAQEEERSRLARELHDGISQELVGVRYAIDLARRKVDHESSDAFSAIERGGEALNGAIKEVRRLSHDLRPGVLDDLGLSSAIGALISNFADRTGIPVQFNAATFRNQLQPGASTALYRVTQEALNNIERHADATRVEVQIVNSKGRLRMIISDNGSGFAESKARPAGLGLRNMQERMAHFGGLLIIKTSSNGTILTAMLPKSAMVPKSAVLPSSPLPSAV